VNELLSQILLASYYLTLGSLAVLGGHRLLMLTLYYRTRREGVAPPPPPDEWPMVTVQLPLFNEMYVAARLIDAICGLDYPRERLEIQVLDDSTDETREIVAESVAEYSSRGFRISHLHRAERPGFKAGALAAGLARAEGGLLAVFDADFVPPPDFLRRTVPYFADPKIGMVQACWEHLNRDYSLLTKIQAIFLDGHFLIEHAARNRSGRFFNFNGTAGVWRRQAILDAGGWQHDTLTEDLDLSYRAQLAGWRFLFLPTVKVPAELPVDINAFKRQQFRWAKGSIQTARKLLPRLLRAPLPWRVRLEAVVHLTNNVAYLLMALLSLLIFPAMMLRRSSQLDLLLAVDLPLFFFATVSVLLFYVASQVARGGNWVRQLARLPSLMGVGIGLALNNSRAVLEGLRQEVGVFERTPKYQIEEKRQGWRDKRYRVEGNLSTLVEGLLAVYFIFAFTASWRLGMWLSLPFLYLFMQGYSYMYLLALIGGGFGRRRAVPARSKRAEAGERS
jgi:cellulose synthase/poly-beta-1,6-N-acetylglucosamine synthase-like glycosyltransferase